MCIKSIVWSVFILVVFILGLKRTTFGGICLVIGVILQVKSDISVSMADLRKYIFWPVIHKVLLHRLLCHLIGDFRLKLRILASHVLT